MLNQRSPDGGRFFIGPLQLSVAHENARRSLRPRAAGGRLRYVVDHRSGGILPPIAGDRHEKWRPAGRRSLQFVSNDSALSRKSTSLRRQDAAATTLTISGAMPTLAWACLSSTLLVQNVGTASDSRQHLAADCGCYAERGVSRRTAFLSTCLLRTLCDYIDRRLFAGRMPPLRNGMRSSACPKSLCLVPKPSRGMLKASASIRFCKVIRACSVALCR